MPRSARLPTDRIMRGRAARRGGPVRLRSLRERLRGRPDADCDQLALQLGWLQAREARSAREPRDAEFSCFSQFGEDGILQWILARIEIPTRWFAEFGVGDYRESNTRFLLEHDNWCGRILDAGDAHLRFVHASGLAWRRTIEARTAFVTAESVNEQLSGLPEDLGLLSIDIDGVDYWVLAAVEVVRPRIIVCEYNALFGADRAVTVPYDPAFNRLERHYSGLYFGASLGAITMWAEHHSYRLVAVESHGANAFLVRGDVAGTLPSLSPGTCWVEPRFRQARDEGGALSYLTGLDAQLALIGNLPLVDVTSGATLRVSDLA